MTYVYYLVAHVLNLFSEHQLFNNAEIATLIASVVYSRPKVSHFSLAELEYWIFHSFID